MAKYDAQLGDLQNRITNANSILIALPRQLNEDKLASGLSLFLSLQDLNKQVSIVSEGTPLVAHTNLFGIGEVKDKIPQGGGNFVLTLEGVVASDGTVPSLEKLDWFPEGPNLNLVFHVLPNQKFEPSKITPQYQGESGGFNLIFIIGASNLSDLGNIYSSNIQIFQGVPLVNIDNSQNNAQFGQLNIVDGASSSISEVVAQVLPAIGLNMDQDIASNLLAGIYSTTNNLTINVSADTFVAVSNAVRSGGKIPSVPTQPPASPVTIPGQPMAPGFDLSSFMPQTPPPASSQPFDSAQGVPPDNFTVPPVVGQNPVGTNQQSFEERPSGEYATSSSPEVSSPSPDWLTPKVYKGTQLG